MASQSNFSLTSTSPSVRDGIPLEIIEEIIVNALDSDSDRQQRYEAFKTLSLVNSHFKATARNHADFFHTQRFQTKQKLRKYMKLVKEYPESEVPQRITTLKMKVEEWEFDADMLESAISAFAAWELHFPNVNRIELCLDNCAYYMTAEDQKPVRLLDAMLGVIASQSLQNLSLIFAKLPAGYFNNAGPALKTLKISNVQALDGTLSFPKRLECLELDTFYDLIQVYEASCTDPELFRSIKELAINDCQCYEHFLWEDSWELIYNLKDSLQRLAVAPGGELIDYSFYPLDILELTKLENLTISTSTGAYITTYIPWISTIFQYMDRILARQPNFTLQVIIYPKLMCTYDDLEDLKEFDDWFTDFFPQNMKVQVIVRVSHAHNLEDYRMYLRNCTNRCILKVEFGDRRIGIY